MLKLIVFCSLLVLGLSGCVENQYDVKTTSLQVSEPISDVKIVEVTKFLFAEVDYSPKVRLSNNLFSGANSILVVQSNHFVDDDFFWVQTNTDDPNKSLSMLPTIGKTHLSLVLEKQAFDISDLQVGDMIVFNQIEALITHRIVALGTDEFGWFAKTRGDNNDFTDGTVRETDIEGVVVAIFY